MKSSLSLLLFISATTAMTKLIAFSNPDYTGPSERFHPNDPSIAKHVVSNNPIGLLVTRLTLLCCMWISFMPSLSQAANTFVNTGPLTTARTYHTATLLPNGKLLVVGGLGNSSLLASAELYDPATGTWTSTGSLATARLEHTSTLLPNGKLLVAGGGTTGGNSLASAELYDPATGIWTSTGPLATARKSHTATLLPNGKVLVAGGSNSGNRLSSAELYDPATGTWTATGSLATGRDRHTATLMPNGKLLVAGGDNGSYL